MPQAPTRPGRPGPRHRDTAAEKAPERGAAVAERGTVVVERGTAVTEAGERRRGFA